jgi:hypothetical protein
LPPRIFFWLLCSLFYFFLFFAGNKGTNHTAKKQNAHPLPRGALGHERGDGLLTRALMSDEPLPWRRVDVDVDTVVDPSWLAATARYVRRLPGTGILTLYAYTTPAYADVLAMLRGGTQYADRALPSPADLAQDRSGIARAGVWMLWDAESKSGARTRGAPRTLESTLPPDIATRVRAHLAAKGAIDRTSEESAKRGWAAWDAGCDALLDAARQHVDARFWTRVRTALAKDKWQWDCIFAHAARALRRRHLSQVPASRRGSTPLARFKAALPFVTAEGWRAILVQYVADLDALFARAPPLPRPSWCSEARSGRRAKSREARGTRPRRCAAKSRRGLRTRRARWCSRWTFRAALGRSRCAWSRATRRRSSCSCRRKVS